MLAPKKRPNAAEDNRRLEPVRTGVFREGTDVVIAFRAAGSHATLRIGRRGAAALTALVDKAVASDTDDYEAEHFLQSALTVSTL